MITCMDHHLNKIPEATSKAKPAGQPVLNIERVTSPPSISQPHGNGEDNPWPYLKKYYFFLGFKHDRRNIEFQCLLCMPLYKKLSTSITSTNNLKKHIKCLHPHEIQTFQQCIDNSRTNKKRKHSDSTDVGQFQIAKKKCRPTSLVDSLLHSEVSQNIFEKAVSVPKRVEATINSVSPSISGIKVKTPSVSQHSLPFGNDDKNPWPYLKEYFSFIGFKCDKRNVEFQCLLCMPMFKKLSTSITSANNLKKHIKCLHPHTIQPFQQCIDDSRTNKNRKYSDSADLDQLQIAEKRHKPVPVIDSLADLQVSQKISEREISAQKNEVIEESVNLSVSGINVKIPPSSTSQQSLRNENDGENPWPYLKEYFSFIGFKCDKRNVEFQCILCIPVFKKLSTSVTSANNLKKHIKCLHPSAIQPFQQCIDNARTTKKRQYSDSVELSQFRFVKKKKSAISLKDSLVLPKVSQEIYENKIISMFAENMLPLDMIESSSFQDFLRTCVPGRNPMSRRTLTKRIEDWYNTGNSMLDFKE